MLQDVTGQRVLLYCSNAINSYVAFLSDTVGCFIFNYAWNYKYYVQQLYFFVSYIDVISDLGKEHKLLQEFGNEKLGNYFDPRGGWK
jgi:hypothetical protein